ncbi:hypothetical protein PPMP20_39530, partial [Paraburkholderia phymatum]
SKKRLQVLTRAPRIPLFRAADNVAREKRRRTGEPALTGFPMESTGWVVKKPVDETKKVLHNLVSLLLTQQRGESKALPANVL